MAPIHQCELRKVFWANPERGDRLLIGFILIGDDGFAKAEFTGDYKRLQCYDPAADPELFAELEKEFNTKIAHPESRTLFLTKLSDWTSNALQLSGPTGLLTADPVAEFAALAKRYLVTPSFGAVREASERARIRKAMNVTFRNFDLMKHLATRIRVSDYVEGDPLQLDYAYTADGHFRIFHAVPVETELDTAKALAFSYPEFAYRFSQKTKLETHLVAIVENHGGVISANRNFAYRAFQGTGIIAESIDELPRLAREVRKQLRL